MNVRKDIAILALCTPKKVFENSIGREKYFFAAQCCSSNALSGIIRNAFRNPEVRYLVLCGKDSNESGKALLLLKKNGVGKDYLIKGMENVQLEKEIPLSAINLFRKKITLVDLRNITGPKEVVKAISSLKPKKPFSERKSFLQPKFSQPLQFPTSERIFSVRESSAERAKAESLKLALRFGTRSKGKIALPALSIEVLQTRCPDSKSIQFFKRTNLLSGFPEGKGCGCFFFENPFIPEKEAKKAAKIIQAKTWEFECDSRGYFIIFLDFGKINCSLFSTEGKKLQEFSGKTAMELYKKISESNAVSSIEHAMYLGTELAKAELALKHKLHYSMEEELAI